MKAMPLLLTLACALGAVSTALARHSDQPKTWEVHCGSPHYSISRALEYARQGDTIRVFGECHEAVEVNIGVTLDGGGSARVIPPTIADSAFTVTGHDVTVRGFVLDAPARFQFFIIGGAALTIESNTISNAENFGISAAGNASVTVLDNVISDNKFGGMIGLTGASFQIGSATGFSPARPNVLADNTRLGLVLVGNASAHVIAGNTITGHGVGILVQDGGQARIAGNIIDGNDIGILVDFGGTVQLPVVANLVPAFVEHNSGKNATYGIACRGGAIAGVPDGLAPAVKLPPRQGVLQGPSDGLSSHCLDQTESAP